MRHQRSKNDEGDSGGTFRRNNRPGLRRPARARGSVPDDTRPALAYRPTIDAGGSEEQGGNVVFRSVVRFCSVLFVALTLAPALAHLLELPHKIQLPRDEYFVVQQIYRGWSLLGVVILAALVSTALLAIVNRHDRRALAWSLVALLALAAAHALFWIFTFPTNQATDNWTKQPENWEALRARWEYSHAAGAALDLVALVAVIVAALSPPAQRRVHSKPAPEGRGYAKVSAPDAPDLSQRREPPPPFSPDTRAG
jgi:hypothetical protein